MLHNKLKVSFGLFNACCWLIVLGLCGCASPKPLPGVASASGQAQTNIVDDPLIETRSLDLLRPNDLVTIVFSGIPSPPDAHSERINERGQITLQLLGPIQAADKTSAQLQEEIQKAYVPKYFQRLLVTVQTENRFFFVRGEVKNPSRQVYAGGLTVLKAIAAAGDFTDFAKRQSVELRRANGHQFIINANKARRNKALDLPVVPGDEIFVPRRIW
jgi:polysaccharide biosynthesis/export protein VpsN